MDIENENESLYNRSTIEDPSQNSDLYASQTPGSSYTLHPSSKDTKQIEFEFVVLDDKEDNKDEVIRKLKKEQLRKRKIQNKLEKAKQSGNQLEVRQMEYVFQPYIQTIAPLEDQFVFGEIVLEGDFYRDPFNMEKAYQWSYWKRGDWATNLKDINCIQVDLKRIVDTETNFEYAIQKYLHMPDQQIHQLGIYLQNYYQKTKNHLSIMNERTNLLRDQQVKEQFQKMSQVYFNKCLEWVKTQVTSEEFYMYVFYEIDFDTLDQNYKNIGYSQNLLKLIGLNEENAIPFILRKGRLEFVDGLSRLKRLIARLYNINNNFNVHTFYLEHDIITVDEQKIPTKCTITTPEFTCFTPQNFEHYDMFFGEFALEYSCFRLFKFDVNPRIVEQVIKERSLQAKDTQMDFEYSLMSELFIDKFYKQSDEEIQKRLQQEKAQLEQNKPKTCGFRVI